MDEVILVDHNDQVVGVAEKMHAHRLGALHRAFSVMLYRMHNDQMEVLLQRRAASKYHCPGLWSNTCCSHPQPGETVLVAAHRRLQEELGIVEIDLTPIGCFVYQAKFDNGLTEHEYDHVLLGYYNDTPNRVNLEEVSEIQWVYFDELKSVLAQQEKGDQYTVWLPEILQTMGDYFNIQH
jgi:isopentenyl-diphosphate delta-isomerase